MPVRPDYKYAYLVTYKDRSGRVLHRLYPRNHRAPWWLTRLVRDFGELTITPVETTNLNEARVGGAR